VKWLLLCILCLIAFVWSVALAVAPASGDGWVVAMLALAAATIVYASVMTSRSVL
jgi:hypothetical protein